MKKLILTHANCVDGCCSRAILETRYGNDAHYVAVEHTDYDPKFPEKMNQLLVEVSSFEDSEVIMSDICLPLSWIEMFLNKNNKVTIIDHHKTAKKTIAALQEKIDSGEKLNIEIYFSEDNSQSGALLTWNYINPMTPPPEVVTYISEGDIWDFKHNETKAFYTGLLDKKQPNDYSAQQWLEILTNKDKVKEIIDYGQPIHESFMQEVYSYIPKAISITLGGRPGMMVFAPSEYRSELGHLLSKQFNGFGLIVEDKGNVVSCRLNSIAPNTIDDLAIKFGGGGHAQSSGFKLQNLKELEELLKNEGNDVSFYLEQQTKKNKNKM